MDGSGGAPVNAIALWHDAGLTGCADPGAAPREHPTRPRYAYASPQSSGDRKSLLHAHLNNMSGHVSRYHIFSAKHGEHTPKIDGKFGSDFLEKLCSHARTTGLARTLSHAAIKSPSLS